MLWHIRNNNGAFSAACVVGRVLMRNRILVGVTLGLASLSASAASFTPLGDLSGGSFYSVARGVSADGSVVVGYGKAARETRPSSGLPVAACSASSMCW